LRYVLVSLILLVFIVLHWTINCPWCWRGELAWIIKIAHDLQNVIKYVICFWIIDNISLLFWVSVTQVCQKMACTLFPNNQVVLEFIQEQLTDLFASVNAVFSSTLCTVT
jgi:hypothetical protein